MVSSQVERSKQADAGIPGDMRGLHGPNNSPDQAVGGTAGEGVSQGRRNTLDALGQGVVGSVLDPPSAVATPAGDELTTVGEAPTDRRVAHGDG